MFLPKLLEIQWPPDETFHAPRPVKDPPDGDTLAVAERFVENDIGCHGETSGLTWKFRPLTPGEGRCREDIKGAIDAPQKTVRGGRGTLPSYDGPDIEQIIASQRRIQYARHGPDAPLSRGMSASRQKQGVQGLQRPSLATGDLFTRRGQFRLDLTLVSDQE